MTQIHTRIIQHPFTASLQGAFLDSYEAEQRGKQLHITLNIRALGHTAPAELFERDGIIYERVHGKYVPAQLYFSGVSELKSNSLFTNLASLPLNDPTRVINDMLAWRQPERQDVFFLFFMHAADNVMFFARDVTYEEFSEISIPVTIERDWSPPPPMPGRLVPRPQHLHRRFGGDPITINLHDKVLRHRLFIGGLEIQPTQRPQVDVVLNLGEEASRWVNSSPGDRAINKGEGMEGMSLDEISEEAEWVIEHLRKGQRVLVHCVAGMNRSSTVCCAALMLLENLSAEAALERVRQHHPWARPDSHHWLALRWLEITKKE